MSLSREVRRLVDAGLRGDVLLLALGLILELEQHKGGTLLLSRAAAHVHAGHGPRGSYYWCLNTIRQDLPRHIPDHEQPGAAPVPCAYPMVRRPNCARPVHGTPYAPAGKFAPVLIGGHVTWHAYCDRHRKATPHDPATREAVRRLPHNSGGLLRVALPGFKVDAAYKHVDRRWEPSYPEGWVKPARLRLLPPLADEGDQ